MKLIELTEARRNPKLNKKIPALKQLKLIKKQVGTTPTFVSFTSINKLGINPSSYFNTPIGIYSYPLNYVISHNITDVPMAGDQPFIQVFQCTSDKIWHLNTFDNNIKQQLISSLHKLGYDTTLTQKATTNKQLWHSLYQSILSKDSPNTTIEEFIDDDNDSLYPKIKTTIRRILLNSNIEAVIDPGKGIIHQNEPTQALFLHSNICKRITTIHNTHIQDTETKDMLTMQKFIRSPQSQQSVHDNTWNIYSYISNLNKPDKQLEQSLIPWLQLTNDSTLQTAIVNYCKKFLPHGLPTLEQYLTTPIAIFDYTKLTQTRSPAMEQKIIQYGQPQLALDYCNKFIHNKWPQAEPLLQKNSEIWHTYLTMTNGTTIVSQ